MSKTNSGRYGAAEPAAYELIEELKEEGVDALRREELNGGDDFVGFWVMPEGLDLSRGR